MTEEVLKNSWKPHPKQAEFQAIPLTIKEAFYGGGAGSAKTETLLTYPLVHRWHEIPAFKQVFMRRTFPELRNEVIPRSREIYRKFGATLNKSDMCWTFPRPDQLGGSGLGNAGANIFLGHCEHEEDVHKYDSMEINLFTPDELTSFTEWIYLYIGYERTRAKLGSGLPAIIRAAGMPGGIGHTWVKKRFVDPSPAGGKIIKGRGGNKRIYIHATLADNPYVDPTYSTSLEALPEAEKQAKKFGSWDAYLGQVFDEFRDKNYPDEPENAIHVIEPFEIPVYWPRIIALDWGFRAMTWVGYGAISPDQRLFIYREQHWKNKKIEEWAPFVKEHIEYEMPRLIKVCKSAGNDTGQEHTIQQQIESAFGCSVELTKNLPGSRVASKQLVHEYLRWKPKPVIPEGSVDMFSQDKANWILRNKGVDSYKNYLALFEPVAEETNLPKLQIFNTCPVLITTIKACVYDKKNPEDVMEFDGDDPYDALRYIVDSAERYFNDSITEFETIRKRQLIEEQFKIDQDWNRVYRMGRLQDSKTNKKKFVTRYHRGIRH